MQSDIVSNKILRQPPGAYISSTVLAWLLQYWVTKVRLYTQKWQLLLTNPMFYSLKRHVIYGKSYATFEIQTLNFRISNLDFGI